MCGRVRVLTAVSVDESGLVEQAGGFPRNDYTVVVEQISRAVGPIQADGSLKSPPRMTDLPLARSFAASSTNVEIALGRPELMFTR